MNKKSKFIDTSNTDNPAEAFGEAMAGLEALQHEFEDMSAQARKSAGTESEKKTARELKQMARRIEAFRSVSLAAAHMAVAKHGGDATDADELKKADRDTLSNMLGDLTALVRAADEQREGISRAEKRHAAKAKPGAGVPGNSK